jgi:L-asparaginase
MAKKTVLIINTGGTISSIQTPTGYMPSPEGVHAALQMIPALSHPDMPDYEIKEYVPLLDSSNITPQEWNRLAADIHAHYAHVDGFVIFHGTDTMAYTASALSFMLENLGKPVILTGSQIPLSEIRNDASDNIITSLWLAAHAPLPEVCIYFNQRLLRGNRAQKISAARLNAFDSPNFPHLARIGIELSLRHDLIRPQPVRPLEVHRMTPQRIANFRLFPGFSLEVLRSLLNQPLEGLIFESYGAGNAPNTHPEFLELLTQATTRGMIIVNCTQCQHGRVQMNQYATGSTLQAAGLISGHNMTTEAAHCKLMVLLSTYSDRTQVKQRMTMDWAGELDAT